MIVLVPSGHHQQHRPSGMQASRESRVVLGDDAPPMGSGVSLGGVLHGVVDDQQVGTEPGYAAVDSGRKQAAAPPLDPPPTDGGFVGAEPDTQGVGVLSDQLARFAAVRLGQLVGVGHEHDLAVGVVGERPDHRPDREEARLAGAGWGGDDVALVGLADRPRGEVAEHRDRRRHAESRVEARREGGRRRGHTAPPPVGEGAGGDEGRDRHVCDATDGRCSADAPM